jgi:hypothetical protein
MQEDCRMHSEMGIEVKTKLSSNRGCRMVSETAYGRILALLDQNRYFLFQVSPQLY